MHIVIYIRHTEGRPGPSIEEQRNVCRKYAAEHGHNILREYVDYSANNPNAFDKMMRDSRKKLFQGILVYSTDRFCREFNKLMTCKVMLKKLGIELISVTEPRPVTPSALMIKGMLEAFADYFHAEHSEKVKQGIQLVKELRLTQMSINPKKAG